MATGFSEYSSKTSIHLVIWNVLSLDNICKKGIRCVKQSVVMILSNIAKKKIA